MTGIDQIANQTIAEKQNNFSRGCFILFIVKLEVLEWERKRTMEKERERERERERRGGALV